MTSTFAVAEGVRFEGDSDLQHRDDVLPFPFPEGNWSHEELDEDFEEDQVPRFDEDIQDEYEDTDSDEDEEDESNWTKKKRPNKKDQIKANRPNPLKESKYSTNKNHQNHFDEKRVFGNYGDDADDECDGEQNSNEEYDDKEIEEGDDQDDDDDNQEIEEDDNNDAQDEPKSTSRLRRFWNKITGKSSIASSKQDVSIDQVGAEAMDSGRTENAETVESLNFQGLENAEGKNWKDLGQTKNHFKKKWNMFIPKMKLDGAGKSPMKNGQAEFGFKDETVDDNVGLPEEAQEDEGVEADPESRENDKSEDTRETKDLDTAEDLDSIEVREPLNSTDKNESGSGSTKYVSQEPTPSLDSTQIYGHTKEPQDFESTTRYELVPIPTNVSKEKPFGDFENNRELLGTFEPRLIEGINYESLDKPEFESTGEPTEESTSTVFGKDVLEATMTREIGYKPTEEPADETYENEDVSPTESVESGSNFGTKLETTGELDKVSTKDYVYYITSVVTVTVEPGTTTEPEYNIEGGEQNEARQKYKGFKSFTDIDGSESEATEPVEEYPKDEGPRYEEPDSDEYDKKSLKERVMKKLKNVFFKFKHKGSTSLASESEDGFERKDTLLVKRDFDPVGIFDFDKTGGDKKDVTLEDTDDGYGYQQVVLFTSGASVMATCWIPLAAIFVSMAYYDVNPVFFFLLAGIATTYINIFLPELSGSTWTIV